LPRRVQFGGFEKVALVLNPELDAINPHRVRQGVASQLGTNASPEELAFDRLNFRPVLRAHQSGHIYLFPS
jgi:hypothetical protein